MIDSFLDWLDPAAGIPFTFLNGTFWLFLWAVIIGFGLLNRLEKRIQARNAFLFAVSLFFLLENKWLVRCSAYFFDQLRLAHWKAHRRDPWHCQKALARGELGHQSWSPSLL